MNPVLLEILKSPWLIHAEDPDVYSAMLLSLLNGNGIEEKDFSKEREQNRIYAIDPSEPSAKVPVSTSSPQTLSVGVIPIRGEIFKYDKMCGPRGTLSIMEDFRSLENNPKIASILLVIDSPGGQVSGTGMLSQMVAQSSKPVVAFIEGLAASAAYWIASGATRIIASSDIDQVGSIGTMAQLVDLTGKLEKEGVKIHRIYATKSLDKNKDLELILKGEYAEFRKKHLDVINERFHRDILANRPGIAPDAMTGKVFFAKDAISMDLIDEIGSFGHALQVALTAEPKSKIYTSSNHEPMNIKMTKGWQAIASFFGFSENVEEKEITSEMMGQINDKLVDMESKISTLSIELADLKAANVQLSEDLAAVTAERDQALQDRQAALDEVATLKQEDGAAQTTAVKPADSFENPDPSDNYAHNKLADR